MRKIVYYVATSLDGYISGKDGDISGFLPYDDVVNKYMSDLKNYDTTIMGRKTYEFGYDYGIQPGQPAYPHMNHFIFSDSLEFENPHKQVHACKMNIDKILELKNQSGTDIYLCGGGAFAGWLHDNHLIDILKIKLNPFIQGEGVPLFGTSITSCRLELLGKESFPEGLQILEYRVVYD